ncbi:YdaU family protein [Pseudooceanicola algae]|uniref:DUF1376 domain-containing protein n=1 Tax=Pseudooceanicola algae TaxID=1537215 RepID=A0A418SDA7_9RHOB|nr:YdaU family protein [Pseudooceanicola algae]QPM89367.1 hypothetical protein PSAL_005830 [Pseudooceanicola algae]
MSQEQDETELIADFWWYPLSWGDTLSNHDWIPLYINRLLTSNFVAYAVAEGRRADIGTALILWSESFKQDPAGTLPDDDVQLAQIARFGADLQGWREARAGVLHGWQSVTIEEDAVPGRRRGGRLGHPVIAEIAADMHQRKAGRDQAREAGRSATLRSRVRKKLAAMRVPKALRESDQVVHAVAGFLEKSRLYCTEENVRVALEEAVGLAPNVHHLGARGGSVE